MPIRVAEHCTSGSNWLLQTTTPDEFVGSLSAWINDEGRGAVQLATFKDSRWLVSARQRPSSAVGGRVVTGVHESTTDRESRCARGTAG
jgi:hypothetical protein